MSNKPNKSITEKEIEAGYKLAKQVYENEMPEEEAVQKLIDDYDMNPTSASRMIGVLQALLADDREVFLLSMAQMEYYLDNILIDYKEAGLEIALEKFRNYLLNANYNDMPARRKMHNRFCEKIGLPHRL